MDKPETYNGLYSDIETYMDENIVKFIVGDKPLDAYDDYVSTLKEMGIDQCTAIYQAAFDRYMNS